MGVLLFKYIYIYIWNQKSEYCFSKINFLFIYFWLYWVFVVACRLSLVVVSEGYSLVAGMGFSLGWLLLLWSTGSRCMGSAFVAC